MLWLLQDQVWAKSELRGAHRHMMGQTRFSIAEVVFDMKMTFEVCIFFLADGIVPGEMEEGSVAAEIAQDNADLFGSPWSPMFVERVSVCLCTRQPMCVGEKDAHAHSFHLP